MPQSLRDGCFAAGDELSVYPTHWVNQSVAAYYGIHSIRSSNDLGDPSISLQNPGVFGNNDTINFNIPGLGLQTISVGTDPSAAGV